DWSSDVCSSDLNVSIKRCQYKIHCDIYQYYQCFRYVIHLHSCTRYDCNDLLEIYKRQYCDCTTGSNIREVISVSTYFAPTNVILICNSYEYVFKNRNVFKKCHNSYGRPKRNSIACILCSKNAVTVTTRILYYAFVGTNDVS